MGGDENRLASAVPFNSWTTAICGEPSEVEDATFDELPQKVLLVPFTSEKGLCGGVNTFISRGIKTCVSNLQEQGKDADIVVIGDKGRSQLRRQLGEKIFRSATEIESPGTFALAAALSSELMAVNCKDYDAVVLMYNSYVNSAVYKQKYKVIKPFTGEGEDEPMMEYEFEPDTKSEILDDLYEYLLTLKYNRARQARITTELIEIISGASALED